MGDLLVRSWQSRASSLKVDELLLLPVGPTTPYKGESIVRHFFCVGILLLVTRVALAETVVELTFDPPQPNEVRDFNGQPTGFTCRLKGTGSAIPDNDPNIDLRSQRGKLLLRSTRTDFNQGNAPGRSFARLEAPGVLLRHARGKNIEIRATFENVHVPNASDQLMLYVAADESHIVRAGFHQGNVYHITQNNGGSDFAVMTSLPQAFQPGDDVQLTLSRQDGVWTLQWKNLSTPGSDGVMGASIPWIDTYSNVYVGIHAANPGSDTPFVATVDDFSVRANQSP